MALPAEVIHTAENEHRDCVIVVNINHGQFFHVETQEDHGGPVVSRTLGYFDNIDEANAVFHQEKDAKLMTVEMWFGEYQGEVEEGMVSDQLQADLEWEME